MGFQGASSASVKEELQGASPSSKELHVTPPSPKELHEASSAAVKKKLQLLRRSLRRLLLLLPVESSEAQMDLQDDQLTGHCVPLCLGQEF